MHGTQAEGRCRDHEALEKPWIHTAEIEHCPERLGGLMAELFVDGELMGGLRRHGWTVSRALALLPR